MEFRRIGSPRPTMVLNDAPAPRQYTVPIVGIPRGGTTMVAAVVSALGVYLGPENDLRQFNFEDQTMHLPYLDKVFACVQERNHHFDRWGWKDPVGIPSIQQVIFALRSPRVIMVFRDKLATIQGEMRFDEQNNIQPRRTFHDLMDRTMHWQQQNVEFLQRAKVPILLVSYERAMRQREEFIEDAAAFLGIENPAREAALQSIGDGYPVW